MPVTFGIDVSFYDACNKVTSKIDVPIDWVKARDVDHLSLALIKSSQEGYIDPAVRMQWDAAGGELPRLAWHFFKPQVSVEAQLNAICNAIGDDFRENDLIALDWEYSYFWYSAQKQRDMAYALLTGIQLRFDTTPIKYIGKPFAVSLGVDKDERFAQFPWWLPQYPYDTDGKNGTYPWITPSHPVWTKAEMEVFKARIQAGIMRPAYSMFGKPPAIWQFTSRCDPRALSCYPSLVAKKAVDFNAVYVDISH